MRVGLFVGSITATDGGGYTYVVELLRALEQAKDSCQHEFVLCHHRGGDSLARIFSQFAAINLDAEKSKVLSVKERLLEPFPGIVERTFDRAFRLDVKSRWEERVYASHGIQFLIRLVPWNRMTMEIPFAAVHWDLQHRNNPWFPEVSIAGEWQGRENNFSSFLRRASLIITGTQRGKNEIEGFYQVPGNRIIVLPLPTPEFALKSAQVEINPESVRKLGVMKDYVLYPAQFWPHKNHAVVLEACKIIREETNWDIGIVFVGSEKGNCDYVKSYAKRLGLEQCTRFLGFVDQSDLVQLYKGAFCLAFATFCGPDNLPPLEAFALGCPVVASSVPGAEEQLGNAALLFEPADEQALAARIIELRNRQLRREMILAGERRSRIHTWDDYAKGIISSLDEFAYIRRAWA
jgi:glycosyltransferase involved in cell wall biosynthesis